MSLEYLLSGRREPNLRRSCQVDNAAVTDNTNFRLSFDSNGYDTNGIFEPLVTQRTCDRLKNAPCSGSSVDSQH